MNEDDVLVLLRSEGKAQLAGLKQLYRSYEQHMTRFFVYQGLSSSEAEDVFQETVIKVLQNVDGFRGQGEARSWIWQIARNCLHDYQRKMARRLDNELGVEDERLKQIPAPNDPDSPPGAADECLSAGLEVFGRSEPDRALVLLMQMDGLEIEEIGVRIGRTSAATKQFLYECRKKLAPYIEHCRELLPA